MITTTFLLLLISFEFFYLTSKQYRQQNKPGYIGKITANASVFRVLAGVLFTIATLLSVYKLGFSSGIIAIIVGLMAAGSLIVLLQPLKYLSLTTIAALYFSVLLLEFFI